MFRNLMKFPLLNTIAGLTLIVGSGLNTLPANASEYLYGYTSSSTPNGINNLLINGSTVLSTSQSQFDSGFNNQGWWSPRVSNFAENDNYIVGDFTGNYFNNFFTFDISDILEPVTSATLRIRRYEGKSDLGSLTQTYSLFDVSTDAATLNNTEGNSSTIFNDLGSGVLYGDFIVTVAGEESDLLYFSLNSNAIADLNNAIALDRQFFSVGGTLKPVPEPSSILGLLAFAGLSLKAVAKRKKVEIK